MAGPLLALLVDVHLEQGDLDAAERAAGRLEVVARAQRGQYLKAAAALARGRVEAAAYATCRNLGPRYLPRINGRA
jgi:hypothetical protein